MYAGATRAAIPVMDAWRFIAERMDPTSEIQSGVEIRLA